MRVLIADDNKENRYFLETVLKSAGHEVISAENGKIAIELLKTTSVNLIISDVLMPEMDGFRLCVKCKGDEQLNGIPIIFVTSNYTTKKDEEFALKLGADKYLIRPIEPDELLRIAEEVAGRTEKQRLSVRQQLGEDAIEFLMMYNERVVSQLEKKLMELEQETVELALREITIERTSKEWRTTFDSISDLVTIHSPDFTIVKVNKAFANTFNKEPQDLIGRKCFELIHNTSEPPPSCPILESQKTKRPAVHEFFEPHLNLFIEPRVSPILDEHGEIVAFVHIVHDISQRKQLEHALSERYKELNCLHSIDMIGTRPELTLDEIYEEVVNLLPAAFQYPGITRARLTLHDKKFETKNYKDTEWKQSSVIKVNGVEAGEVQVVYLEKKPDIDEGPFLEEKRQLVNSVAEQLARITETKQAEAALKESEQNLVKGQEIGRMGFWKLNPVTQEVEGSDELLRIFALGHDDLTLNTFTDVVHPEDREYDLEHIQRGIEKGVPWDIEHRLLLKNGSIRWIRAIGKPNLNENGEVTQIIGIVQDITERKQAEERLQVEEQNFRNSLESSPLGIRIVTANGELLYANRAMLDICGCGSLDEFKSIPTKQQYTPQSFAEHQERQKKRDRGEFVPLTYGIGIIRGDGAVRHLQVFRKEIIWNDQKQYQVLYQDITEHKQAEEELRKHREHLEELVDERTRELREAHDELLRSERLATLGQLSGSISHELRNPLGVIDSSVYYLKSKLKGLDEKTLEHLDRIKSAVSRSTAIIESLLNLTRMKAPQLEKLDLAAVTSDAIDTSSVPASVRVVKEFPEQEVTVNADREQLRIAFKNIVKNAVQAMDGKGMLTVAVRSIAKGQAEVTFADTGAGIAPENLDKVFQPLFSTRAKGIGFGLSIVKMVVDKHGGTIEAKSESGKGAIIIIHLPLYSGGNKEGISNE